MEPIDAIARTLGVTRRRLSIFRLFVALLGAQTSALAAGKRAPAAKKTDLATKLDDLKEKIDAYKESLRALIPDIERRVADKTTELEKIKGLVDQGIAARKELTQREEDLAKLKAELVSREQELAGADVILEEAVASEQALRNPIKTGGYLATNAIIRYGGAAGGWNIANISQVQGFYSLHFRRAIPISAFGQTGLHDRLGFDHRNAVDVAVHPDSAEGQALISYLRTAGIPFLAFRGAIPGKATGPHIHIGFPSHRFR